MNLYQLYCDASLITGIVRPNPSLVFNYKVDADKLSLDAWLYDKSGKSPVKNASGAPVPVSAPYFHFKIDMDVSLNFPAINFPLLNMSKEEIDELKWAINSNLARVFVLAPESVNSWTVYVAKESLPPFTLIPLPNVNLTSTFNPSPPREIAK